MLCSVGGLLSCGLTHTAVVPLDIVKCRIQVNPAKYQSIINGFKVSVAEEGLLGLTKGWAPTLIGYSIQGVGKFGFYELFKIVYGNMLGEVNLFYFFLIAISFEIVFFNYYLFCFCFKKGKFVLVAYIIVLGC
jgi:solute carrier family 25 phosphate transporter 3